jgi:hypothetical protein
MDALVRIRTHTAAPAARALFASVGRCLHSGDEPSTTAEGAGLNARGYLQYQDRHSGANQAPALTDGVSSPVASHHLKQASATCFLCAQDQAGADRSRSLSAGSARAAGDDAFRRDIPYCLAHWKESQMNRRLCRSVRRAEPDCRYGAADARPCHARH